MAARFTFLIATLLLTATAFGAERPGETTTFRSPRGLTEACTRLPQMSTGVYSEKDAEQEKFFCGIDVYTNSVAMCAKYWSTSPGTMIYTSGKIGQAAYESSKCGSQSGHEKLAKFKNTMNADGTSATFSPSPLLYYHLSRYFETELGVPVAVYRSFDRVAHYRRVSSRGRGVSDMLIRAWDVMRAAEQNPRNYTPVEELFTQDREQIYGIMLRDKGERYGAEVNGSRAGGWGLGEHTSFQETPGFRALRSAKELNAAVDEGVSIAMRNSVVANDVGRSPLPRAQVVYWMRELSEIALLDYILSQQDRVGNVDFEWKWYYLENGNLRSKTVEGSSKDLPRKQMAKIAVPAELKAFSPILLQRTYINDNDAGGRVPYANWAKKTQMLEKIRHLAPVTYRKLIRLEQDLRTQGPLRAHLKNSFGLSEKQFAMVAANVTSAAAILRRSCEAGQMRFDLEPRATVTGRAANEQLNCANP